MVKCKSGNIIKLIEIIYSDYPQYVLKLQIEVSMLPIEKANKYVLGLYADNHLNKPP